MGLGVVIKSAIGLFWKGGKQELKKATRQTPSMVKRSAGNVAKGTATKPPQTAKPPADNRPQMGGRVSEQISTGNIAKVPRTLVRVAGDGTRNILTKNIDFQFSAGIEFDLKLAKYVESFFSKLKADAPNLQSLGTYSKFIISKNNEVKLHTDDGVLIGNLVHQLVPPNAQTQVLRPIITFIEFHPLVK